MLNHGDLLDHDELSGEEFERKDDVRDEDSKNNQGQGRLDKYEYDDDYLFMTFICT